MEVLIKDRIPVLGWVKGLRVEETALEQLKKIASLSFITPHVAVMPDVHFGIGATVGSVIPTKNVLIPSAVGVDIGCGMMAVNTTLNAKDLPDTLYNLRLYIESLIPVGNNVRNKPIESFKKFNEHYEDLISEFPCIKTKTHPSLQLGTLGGGNHFIEICLDEHDSVWVMLHTGSRGIGGKIGSFFTEKAKEEMLKWHIDLPDKALAYLPKGSEYYDSYVKNVYWAQEYALENRKIMMEIVLDCLSSHIKPFIIKEKAIDCHHNYVSLEHHYNQNLWITRKGSVRARFGDLGIIPGSMGACSYIVRGLGNKESFCSCSHGAGRVMSRTEAKKLITLEDHNKATLGIECRKDAFVLDESPAAYKDIDTVMEAQKDLVEILFKLRQVMCIKG